MTVNPYLRTKDLAEAVQISVQQVRNYEASGFLPTVERSPSGYRRYTQQHLVALTTSRQLIAGYGWQRAQQIMRAVHRDRLADALALIDARHAELAETRLQLDQTLAALGVLAAQLPAATPPRLAQHLRVGAAARLVGVRVSALRFWEQQGLLQPGRDASSKYRPTTSNNCAACASWHCSGAQTTTSPRFVSPWPNSRRGSRSVPWRRSNSGVARWPAAVGGVSGRWRRCTATRASFWMVSTPCSAEAADRDAPQRRHRRPAHRPISSGGAAAVRPRGRHGGRSLHRANDP